MKKITILLIFSSVLVISGCSFGKSKLEKYQEVMEDYGRDYYEKYQKNVNLSSLEVTIASLKNANNKGENYDLTKLEKCKDTSKIIFTLNEETKDIESVNLEMECEK